MKQYKKLTRKDQVTIIEAYTKKIDEYSKMSLEELKDLFPKLGGTYREACLHVVEKKLQTEKNIKLEEAIGDIRNDIQDAEIIEEPNIESNESSTN